ncbi:MAG: hypothetical protein ACJ0P6_05160 [Flavobacteriaceae bacterium]|jgi:hypothetical protein|tara:strand:- start:198 stop:1088 length:891 start_codon:yes stop_codon:yes gene_type:complete
MTKTQVLDRLYDLLISEKVKFKIEKIILIIGMISFVVHLALIYLKRYGLLNLFETSNFFDNPIAAIYTPFSFILIYEVYLLIFYLPRSITTYITKQYEIITLIVIRRIFKDLSNLELSSNWFEIKNDIAFTYDIITALLLFFLIYLFSYLKDNLDIQNLENPLKSSQIQQFIDIKKIMASALIPIFIVIGLFTFGGWITSSVPSNISAALKDVNSLFFDEFFAVLIIVDVLLLLVSFFYTDQFHKVIRNSGFIISTILIRMSFTVEGFINNILIIASIVFGLGILWIHNKFAKNLR